MNRISTRRTPALAAALALASGALAAPLGQAPYVRWTKGAELFPLAGDGAAAPIHVADGEWPGVTRAARDLGNDIASVTSLRPEVFSGTTPKGKEIVLVGTLGKSGTIDALAKSGKLDVRGVRGKWEAFVIQVVNRPMPGVDRALVIAGSDKRGTIYGLYDVSEGIGVSPWHWWADVPVKKHERIGISSGRYVEGEPKVKYRGIFLNDEAPALSGWTWEKNGGFNRKLYTRVFELLLRMKANYLWPAMWGNAFNVDDPENPRLADEYGIVMGTSHHEPMLRAQQEWKLEGKGPWDYSKNEAVLREFWTKGVRRNAAYESIITLAMRGDGDEPMTEGQNIALLERIVRDQRQMIAENVNPDVTKVPQLWALYKEVQAYYEKGMRVPDDVTLLWCDDNWGNIRRLPTLEERKRTGGAGIYYHFDYVGGPRNYKWLNTNPLPKIWEQMDAAYDYGADRIWIVNVGDLKPMEFPISFFLTMARDPKAMTAERIDDFTRDWAEQQFGSAHAGEIAEILRLQGKYTGRRKPELLDANTYSLVNYNEAANVVNDYGKLVRRVEALERQIPTAQRDAFWQLILYPVKANAIVHEMYLAVARNRLFASQGRAATHVIGERAKGLFEADAALSRRFNTELADGKWNHFADQTHIGYTSWQQPEKNVMPEIAAAPAEGKGFGVAIEGSTEAWPGGKGEAVLPTMTALPGESRRVEIFARGHGEFPYKATASEPWVKISEVSGDRWTRYLEISVDPNRVPVGRHRPTVTFTGANGENVTVAVPVVRPAGRLDGFVESGGVVSMEAAHFARKVDAKGAIWREIPDYGRTLSAMTVGATAAPQEAGKGAHLEYRMVLVNGGPVKVETFLAPTQKYRPGEGFRYAVSIDDRPPVVVNIHEGYDERAWEASVAQNARRLLTNHQVSRPGVHTLKFWAIDPGLVLEKLVVHTGEIRPSYLGPPESFRIK